MIAVKNSIISEAIHLTELNNQFPNIDIIGCKLFISHRPIFIFTLYILCEISHADLEEFFDSLILIDILQHNNIIIIGDFNVPLFNSNSEDSKSMILNNSFSFLNLRQLNTIKNNNDRLLDLLFSNINCKVCRNICPLVDEDYHHPALEFEFNTKYRERNGYFNKNTSCKQYNFKKSNFYLLYDLMLTANWETVYQCESPDLANNILTNIMHNIFDSTVPTKKLYRRHFPSWFSSETILNIRRKETVYKKWKRLGRESCRQEFIHLRSLIKTQINTSYLNFIRNSENNIVNNPSEFWAFINNKKSNSRLPGKLINELTQESFQTPQEIVKAFANYFKSVYTVCDETIEHHLEEIYTTRNEIIKLNEITHKDIVNASRKLKNKLTCGPDNIPSLIVKDCIHVLLEPLTYIFNLILKTHVYPEQWKISRVCPILKKGDPGIVQNYRPISILCVFSKLFEIILYDLLYNSVKDSLSVNQHGFMKNRSCITNLACFSQYVCESFDAQLQVDTIYLDFQKAFDQINHSILLLRLDQIGTSDSLVRLFSSYLSHRIQFVEYQGYSSEFFTSPSGVPQGSNLGPLLFLIFIDSLSKMLTCSHLFYADDLKLYNKVSSIEDSMLLHQNLISVVNWCTLNRLNLNIGKCNIVSFTRKKNPLQFLYTIDNIIIERRNEIKDLGITFDHKFSFAFHISNIITSAHKLWGFIYRNSKEFNNIVTCKALFYSFVRSKLEYGSLIWYTIYNTYIQNIESVQRKFVKYIFLKDTGAYPERGTDQSLLLRRFSMISLSCRRFYLSLIFLYNLINYMIDCPELLEKINFRIPRTVSRTSDIFYINNVRTNVCYRSPLNIMCYNFNQICSDCDINNCNFNELLNLSRRHYSF